MTAATKGPWSVYHVGKTLSVCIGEEANGKRPCIVDWPGFDGCDLPFKTQVANARLIAAAPELYEACASVWLMLADTNDNELRLIADECRTALSKANGEQA